MKNKILIIIFTTVFLLCIPFIAMLFTDEVNWSLADFIVAGILLLSTGLLCELVIRKTTNIMYRIYFCVGILLIFLIIWVELAVGIFGTALSGN
jgi:hypothetical protein